MLFSKPPPITPTTFSTRKTQEGDKKASNKGNGKSVEDITQEIKDLCKFDVCKVKSIVRQVFCDLGLTDVVTIEEKCAFNWKAALVVVLGVLQITVGGFAVACSSGILATIGWSIVTEGLNDIWTGALALYKGDQNFVKSWANGKAASIAKSIATFGFGQVKSALEGANGFKSALTAAKGMFETVGKEIWTAKEIPAIISSKSFPTAMANTSKEVAVHAGKELFMRGIKHVLESVNKKIKTNFEHETRMRLKKELHKAMESKGEYQDSLEIPFHTTQKDTEKIISDVFMNHQNLLESNSIGRHGILHGCVKTLLKVVKSKMEKSDAEMFEEPLSSIVNIIDTCQKQSSINVEELVSVYCQNIDKALKNIYSNEFRYIEESDIKSKAAIISDVKQSLASKIEDQLFQLIQDSFECTFDGLLIEKLQNTVDGMVSQFSDDNGVGKHVLQNIYSILEQRPHAIMNTGLDAIINGIDVSSDDQTKTIDGRFSIPYC